MALKLSPANLDAMAHGTAQTLRDVQNAAGHPIHFQETDKLVSWANSYAQNDPIPFADKVEGYRLVRRAHPQIGAAGGVALEPQVVIPFTDEDVKVMNKKRDVATQVKFDQYVAANFARATPAEQERLKTIYPAYFENKLQFQVKQHEIALRLAKLSIMGPQSVDDLQFMYAVGNTNIPLNDVQPAQFANVNQAYVNGLFAPNRADNLIYNEANDAPNLSAGFHPAVNAAGAFGGPNARTEWGRYFPSSHSGMPIAP